MTPVEALADLRIRAAKLVAKHQADHARKILDNGDDLKRSLDACFPALDRTNQGSFRAAFIDAKAMGDPNGRIVLPKGKVRPLSPKGGAEFDRCLKKQWRLEAEFDQTLDSLRGHYLKQLHDRRDTADEAGLVPIVRSIQKEIDACGADGSAFDEHFERKP